MSVKIKWLGGPGEPEENVWNGIVFPKGKFVDVTDRHIIAKVSGGGNAFYEMKGDDEPKRGRGKKAAAGDEGGDEPSGAEAGAE